VSLDVSPRDSGLATDQGAPGRPPGLGPAPAFPSEWEITRSTTWRDRGARRRRRRLPVAATLLLGAALVTGLAASVEPLVGLAVLAAVPMAVVVVRRPNAVTVAVLALVYINAPIVLMRYGANPLLGSLVPLGLVIPLVHRILLRGERLTLPRTLPLMMLFGATQATSALASDDLALSLAEVFGFLMEGLALFVLVTGNITSTKILRRALWAIVLGGAFLGLLSLVQQLTGTFSFDYLGFAQVSDSIIPTEGGRGTTTNVNGDVGLARLAGPVGEKNRYAQILVVLVPIALGLMPGATRRGKWVAAACIVFHIAGIVLTYSRGAVVGLVFVLLAAVVLRLVPVRALLVLLLAGSVALTVLPTYRDRVVSLTKLSTAGASAGTQTADASIQGRATENFAALLAFRENLATGIGPGAYPRKYVYYAQRVGGRPRLEERESHNLFLGMAAELGAPGILAFLALMWVLLADLWRSRRIGLALPASSRSPRDDEERQRVPLAAGLLIALSTYLVTGVFLHLAYQRYLWLLVALCAVAGPLSMATAPASATPRVEDADR
jgi:putative inorganic carbon (HCO3(-)) transporter